MGLRLGSSHLCPVLQWGQNINHGEGRAVPLETHTQNKAVGSGTEVGTG